MRDSAPWKWSARSSGPVRRPLGDPTCRPETSHRNRPCHERLAAFVREHLRVGGSNATVPDARPSGISASDSRPISPIDAVGDGQP
jgi:hypothetical protein